MTAKEEGAELLSEEGILRAMLPPLPASSPHQWRGLMALGARFCWVVLLFYRGKAYNLARASTPLTTASSFCC